MMPQKSRRGRSFCRRLYSTVQDKASKDMLSAQARFRQFAIDVVMLGRYSIPGTLAQLQNHGKLKRGAQSHLSTAISSTSWSSRENH